MALRAKKPEIIEKRLKALFYGAAGAGKTTAAIQFPKPYLIDTEKGSENKSYVEFMEKSGGVVYKTSDFDDLIKEVKALLTEKHEYKTLIIDPLTIVYDDLLNKAAQKVGTDFGRHYGEANKSMKQLMNLLLRLDMNVIITSHAKNEYGDGMHVIGQTFDCYKKLDYLFDLVFEVQVRGKGANIQRVGVIRKTRMDEFPLGDTFPFNYDEIANKYGRNILEKESIAQELASQEQLDSLNALIDLMKVPEETQEKWLKKGESECWAEMTSKDIQIVIDHLKSLITIK